MEQTGIGRVVPHPTQDESVGHENPEQLFAQRAIAERTHWRAIQEGEDEEDGDGKHHGDNPGQFAERSQKVNGTQDGVEGEEIPLRDDVCRCLHGVGGDVIVGLQKGIGGEEDKVAIEDQEHANAVEVFNGVVGMERQIILVVVGIDADGIVGVDGMQGPQVDEDHAKDQQRQEEMQDEEAVEGGIGNREPAPDPGDQIAADDRDGAHQVGDDGGTPIGHLPPGEDVTHESGPHEHEEDDDADPPEDFPRGAIGAVVHAAEDVDVDEDEEKGGTVGVHVAQQPAKIDIPHDVFNRLEGERRIGFVMHGEKQAGGDHDDEDRECQRAEVPPIIQIFWGGVFGGLTFDQFGYG